MENLTKKINDSRKYLDRGKDIDIKKPGFVKKVLKPLSVLGIALYSTILPGCSQTVQLLAYGPATPKKEFEDKLRKSFDVYGSNVYKGDIARPPQTIKGEDGKIYRYNGPSWTLGSGQVQSFSYKAKDGRGLCYNRKGENVFVEEKEEGKYTDATETLFRNGAHERTEGHLSIFDTNGRRYFFDMDSDGKPEISQTESLVRNDNYRFNRLVGRSDFDLDGDGSFDLRAEVDGLVYGAYTETVTDLKKGGSTKYTGTDHRVGTFTDFVKSTIKSSKRDLIKSKIGQGMMERSKQRDNSPKYKKNNHNLRI